MALFCAFQQIARVMVFVVCKMSAGSQYLDVELAVEIRDRYKYLLERLPTPYPVREADIALLFPL
jgi:hypothetical protein